MVLGDGNDGKYRGICLVIIADLFAGGKSSRKFNDDGYESVYKEVGGCSSAELNHCSNHQGFNLIKLVNQ